MKQRNNQLKSFQFEVINVNDKGEEIKRKQSVAQYYTEDLGNGATIDMVYISRGEFVMGSPLGEGYEIEKPQHKVNVPSFYMSKYPITQQQWKAIATQTLVDRELQLNPSYFQDDKLPVESVSWNDAVEFCDRTSRKTGIEHLARQSLISA